MKVIGCLAAMSLLTVAAARGELSPPETVSIPSAERAVQQQKLDDRIAMQTARVAEDLERRVATLIELRLAMRLAGADADLPPSFAHID